METRVDFVKPKQLQQLQRKILRIISSRLAVHTEVTMEKTDMIKSVQFDEDGNCEVVVQPNRTHCPCCLLDLQDFHSEIKAIKGIGNVLLSVEGVPDNERWTRSLNQ